MRRFGTVMALLVVTTAACQEPPLDDVDTDTSAIIGGFPDLSDPAVVGLRMCVNNSCGTCTGTLVSRESVLTAAHCVDGNINAGEPQGVRVFFGADTSGSGTWIVADAVEMHRYFDPETLDYDIAMVHMSEPAPIDIDPVALNEAPLSSDMAGDEVRLVGFGETFYQANDSGTKRQVTSTLNSVAPMHFAVGDEDHNTCKGDSGGPTFKDFDGVEYQIGVTSRSRACAPNSIKIRVDVFLDDIVNPFIDRFEGPCAIDGDCTTSCPRSPDPDCDICLWDGYCGTECAGPDWDCPLGLANGESCTDDDQCEWKQCLEATDDARVTYCSDPCDPDQLPTSCFTGMQCADVGGGDFRCVYDTPTPGALGATCGTDDACRSGICEDNTCVELCDDVVGGECPAPFECRGGTTVNADVCGPAIDSGGCRVGGAEHTTVAWALLVVALLVATRRRRFIRVE
jgi:MYXO-CTERM domain-containing protein